MKNNNKPHDILSCIIAIVVYCILGAAILLESKLAYALILLTAILMLCLLWEERFNILKLWAILMLIYSVFVLIGWNGEALIDKSNGNPLVALFVLLAKAFAIHSAKIVIVILTVGIIFVKPFTRHIRIALSNVIYGPLPDMRGIVKGNRKIYLSRDYHTKQIQVIFRSGSKKKILDTYEAENALNPEDHYSLEWEEEKELIVRKYDVYNHEVIMERQYKVPKY